MTSPAASAALHCGIVTSRFVATCEFYFEYFGFMPEQITAEYALLGRGDGSRLGVLRAGGDGQPAALVPPTRGSGLWLAFRCDDVDRLHERLVTDGVEIVGDPEFTISGERRCVARDPNGVLIYITQSQPLETAVGEAAAAAMPSHFHHHEDQSHRIHRLSRH